MSTPINRLGIEMWVSKVAFRKLPRELDKPKKCHIMIGEPLRSSYKFILQTQCRLDKIFRTIPFCVLRAVTNTYIYLGQIFNFLIIFNCLHTISFFFLFFSKQNCYHRHLYLYIGQLN